jgi:uncharacterized protein YjbI with pentapeptide repeats
MMKKLARTDIERMQTELAGTSVGAKLKLEFADLSGADLSGMDLRGCSFPGADLKGANLNRARLEGASFRLACICDALFFDASMEKCDLSGSCCEGSMGLDYRIENHTPEQVNKAFKQRKWISVSDGILRILGPGLKQVNLRGMSEVHRTLKERGQRVTPEGSEATLIALAERLSEEEMQ